MTSAVVLIQSQDTNNEAPSQVQQLHTRITDGLDHILRLECLERSPSTQDMKTFFKTLKEEIQKTRSCVGISIYKPNNPPRNWDIMPKEFDFVTDITNMMKEIYQCDPLSDHSSVRWGNFFQLVFEPIMERLGSFKHVGVLMCADPVIDKYINYVDASTIVSDERSVKITKAHIQLRSELRKASAANI